MTEFVSKKLRDLIGRPISGKRPAGGVSSDTEGVPSLGGENVMAQGGVTYENLNRVPNWFHEAMPKGRLQPLDVLINKDGAQTGKVGLYKGDFPQACVNEHLFILRGNGEAVDQRFLYYSVLLPDTQAKIARRITGSAQPGLNTTFVDAVDIHLPSNILDQRYIAEILSKVDDTIEQTEALIAKYQQIKTGLMHDLFTRGVTPDGRLRPTRQEAPQLYHESPLGWIPKDWDVVTTEDKVSVVDAQPDHRTPPEEKDGVPYVGIGDVTENGDVDLGRARKVSVAAFREQITSFDVNPGAFIFGKIGTLGKPRRIPHERFFAVSANVVLFTARNRKDIDYSYWIYNSSVIERQLSDATNTTSQPALGIQKIRKFRMPWPATTGERDAICLKMEAVSRKLVTELGAKEKLLLLKRGLMHDLLTGRVQVKGSEAVAA